MTVGEIKKFLSEVEYTDDTEVAFFIFDSNNNEYEVGTVILEGFTGNGSDDFIAVEISDIPECYINRMANDAISSVLDDIDIITQRYRDDIKR